jgi:hypothetical protein
LRLAGQPAAWIKSGRSRKITHNTAALLVAVLCLFGLSGCLGDFDLPTLTPIPPTATVTQTPTSTATIIWFPATATFTPAPTLEVTPTPDMRPTFGSVLFKDTFTDKTQWPVSRSGVGSIAYGKNELTLAVSGPRGTLAGLRKEPGLDDFFLQVEILPSMCRNDDMYGLLLRAESVQDAYRLLMTCSGKVRLERLKGGKVLPLQDWTQSGQIFPGGLMRTRLGVWAQGDHLHVFVNDVYQFSVRDTVWDNGKVGLFARSAGDTPLTVSFSDLVVYRVNADGRAQPTTAPEKNSTPTGRATSTRKP